MFIPLTSWNPPRTVFASPVVKSTMKLKLLYGLSRGVAISPPCRYSGVGSGGGRRGPLADAEDHELGGPGRGDADDADEPAVGQVVLGHRGGVALDVEALLRLAAQQRAGLPFAQQEPLHGVPHRVPQRRPVDLEDDPLGTLVDRLLQVVEVPAHAEVLPLRVVADRPRTPDEEAGSGEEAQAVDAFGVEQLLLGLVEPELEVDGGAYDLVGGRFDDADVAVAARPDPRQVRRRRHPQAGTVARVGDDQPRVVDARVVRRAQVAERQGVVGQQTRRRVEGGHPVTHLLAVGDDRVVDGLGRALIGAARYPSGAGSRHGHDGDVVDRLQRDQAALRQVDGVVLVVGERRLLGLVAVARTSRPSSASAMSDGRSSGGTDGPPSPSTPSSAIGTVNACARLGGLALSTTVMPPPAARGSKPSSPTASGGPKIGRPCVSTPGRRTSTRTVTG